ncbi:MAG: hypothetical protein OXU78_08625 [Deltaproteobacteria bacterium]|nr:hypothetical protein [Deltaproteobacteria bacterium]
MRRAALWAFLAVALAAAACGKLGPPLRAPEAGAGQQTAPPPETPGPGSEAEAGQEESP